MKPQRRPFAERRKPCKVFIGGVWKLFESRHACAKYFGANPGSVTKAIQWGGTVKGVRVYEA